MNARPYIAPKPSSKPIGAFFRWEIPGEAVGVHLSLNVIELIERDAARAGEKIAAGVLLGRTHHGRELTLTVEHYESATPERGASESPFANPQALEAMLDRWRPGRSRMSVLGFYRSAAEESALNSADLAAVQATLEGTKGSTGAARMSPIKEAGRDGSEATGDTSYPAIQDPERIFLLIEPRAGRLSTASLYLARKGVVVCQSPRIPFNRTELAKTGTAGESQPSEYRAPAYTAQELDRPNERQPAGAPRSKFQFSWLRYWRRALVALSMLPIALAVFISIRGNPVIPHLPNAIVNSSSDSELGLKLDRSGAAWKLSWDANTAGVRSASNGRLLITDGVIHRDLELTPSDLHGGTIIYTPLTDNVVLQLQIDSPGAAEPLSASVRTVGGGVSDISSNSLPSPTVPPLQTSGVPPLDEAILRQPARPVSPPPSIPPVPEKTGPVLRPVKTAPEPLAPSRSSVTKLETPSRNLKPEPKKQVAAAIVPPSPSRLSPQPRAITQTPSSTARIEAETIPVVPATAPQTPSITPAEKYTDNGSAIEVARLVSRQDPVYPESAKELGLAGTVEVHFTIGKDGQVHDVSVVKGFSELGEAAIDAVRKWRYSPAKIDGIPTESEASAVFVFKRS